MEKVKYFLSAVQSYVSGTNFALLVFLGYSLKGLIGESSYEDVSVFVAACGLYGYSLFLKSKTPDPVRINNEIQTQINELQKNLRDTHMQNNLKKTKIQW